MSESYNLQGSVPYPPLPASFLAQPVNFVQIATDWQQNVNNLEYIKLLQYALSLRDCIDLSSPADFDLFIKNVLPVLIKYLTADSKPVMVENEIIYKIRYTVFEVIVRLPIRNEITSSVLDLFKLSINLLQTDNEEIGHQASSTINHTIIQSNTIRFISHSNIYYCIFVCL
jgi:hypothetical protein